ncbi:PREDICTED: bifunctional heparan sulfate N-deacetylase/N-sulfotransferase [Papilio xuthus]|uniref:[heparan sulfate]-glucosamine N-sulfotransferase n=1 Tax=Papilio xuthus TaxID=66420 RepID=A0AAJ6ZRU6_PAPXU|nr:PREDICTED: bifunctional heparan sulfate N-deacetylase/N-sulfotransferase [Papilio xuthus]XP_013178035.1 PREDICTED: bifunctional heparan sulfate N-deacetylase/N-sulfotransferase [Papilio xuthus]XP_013178036.1 PREDICTED: bifunctional heparan sulfate N-deacetylase/N-sulfotransferase [Papilio xuthus]XP_013178037.1 PREDICTED: bifunctional heparan sulfate N-deacetylase/N-sulfotransferase [Papilio xuthus]XP_013178038.1 PREDICTED: bifunctional heparan sulfate N-deacetylase/N-sulfotransferase [Papili
MSGEGRGSRTPLLECGYAPAHAHKTPAPRCCFWLASHINVRKCVAGVMLLSVLTIFFYTYYVTVPLTSFVWRDRVPRPLSQCSLLASQQHARDHSSDARLRSDAKVLVIVESAYSRLGRDIAELLVANRIRYKVEVAGKSLPVLTTLDKGRYGVIIFESLNKYANMDKWNRELLDKYCREYAVGVVGFATPGEETLVGAQLKGFPLFMHTNLRLKDATLNPASPVLRLSRAGETAWGALPGDHWTVFRANSTTYEPVAWAVRQNEYGSSEERVPLATVIQDHGRVDGVQRVLFGAGLQFWLHRLLLLDALSYLSHGQLSLSLDRWILVDIDDIFVGERGTRLHEEDVSALLASQAALQRLVAGFRFNLGFSAKYYHHGTPLENRGDDALLRNREHFTWFCHMWNHQQPHLYNNVSQLEAEMMLNKQFALEHGIPTNSCYSVSPHHSGVYPVHEPLYEAWRKVWDVQVTSTEEYPHLRPARLRRGFRHRGVMVLPRQTCGLFTHTLLLERYPGGRQRLDRSIQGGELFQTVINNPINIFMTHMSNYGNDRLALYTFESVVKFLRCWTNVRLASAPPLALAHKYFQLRPDELNPLWGNPCDDIRHRRIWSKSKWCGSLPRVLVIGPQKTGSTALYSFLAMHPALVPNLPSPTTYEELQFFNNNNYLKGLDWYLNFFPANLSNSSQMAFEKSATYFDAELAPRRAHALLPTSKIIAILISPSKRAYSWYQHIRSHGDPVARNYTFHTIITANDSAPKPLKDLRNRCLNPGKYSHHLERWVSEFGAHQLHVVDGAALRAQPAAALHALQKFLKLSPHIDYNNLLKYDAKKGFFCQVTSGEKTKCLGKSKGRIYPPMEERSAKFLKRYYTPHNAALSKLLVRLGRPVPPWLKEELSNG